MVIDNAFVATTTTTTFTITTTLAVIQCMWNFVLPYIFNPDQANLGAKTAFIFGGLSILCCIYLYFHHPESRGRSYEELDEMFIKGLGAREFDTYVTDAEIRAREVKREVEDGKMTL
jgi:SP family general alpha glucoside:H+ symporter-like MFS transporter